MMKLAILVFLVILLCSCSSRKVMRDCKAIGDGFFQCDKP